MRRYQLEIKEINFLSIDAVAMYPSMNFPLVKKSISYFTRNLPKNHQSTIKLCFRDHRICNKFNPIDIMRQISLVW